MDWNALKVFLAIANKGSLSGAATQLQVNHSTIFRRLHAFEDEIGGRLFERINNRYQLTEMGQELAERAKEIEDAFDGLERHIVGKDYQPKGIVKITSPSNVACLYLSDYIAEFNRLYEDIHIELLASNQEMNMNNRQADIAVRATPEPPEQLVGRKICDIGWGIYGSQAYEEQFGLPTNVQELVHHRLVGAAGGMVDVASFQWLEKHFSEQLYSRCDDLLVMSYLVESGHSLAILPNDQARTGIKKLFPIEQAKPSGLWLLTHSDLRHVERIKLVMQFLTQSLTTDKHRFI